MAAVAALTPLAYLVVRAFDAGADTVWRVLWQQRTLELALRSLALAAAVAAACLVLGVLGAWLAVRSDLPGRRVAAVLLVLPLAVPSYVAAFTWIAQWRDLSGFFGAFVVLTLVSFPYVLLPVAAALRTADPALEEVARSLGKSAPRTFLLVTLRHIRPAATAGTLLVALYVLSDFGAVSLMRFEAFTLGIYTSYQATFDRTPAAILGCVLVVLALLLTVGERRARGAAEVRSARGAARPAATVRLGRARIPALLGVVVLLVLSLGVPVFSLVRWLIVGRSAGIDVPDLVSATLGTVTVAGAGALLTVALAIPVGVLAARQRGRLSRGVELASFAGHALPGITVGLALVFFGIRVAPQLYQRTPMLAFAYAVLFLPLAVGAVRTAVAQAPPVLEDVSRSLGRGRLLTQVLVTMPLAAPGVLAGAALVFLTSAKELPATLLLRPTGTDTLATELWSSTEIGAFAAAAPYAAVLLVVAAVPAVLLDQFLRKGGRR
ncbi:ABC-type Fe3+ transport system, permease component [Saccharomonospora marina XMU15]|uniref:ABC-type Fe3+ transport system, permease component n=1 Tax=Saccharomonospora marina XMU15 TaxID=882083 RepID=H5X5J0_9PSEU|nr:iron ABC transporter permease [Saccharomonospora marina]EHR50062.1 ABC-type Fe3+ transport system, permease component [Saccharomonospora marina XMU15]